MLQTPEKCDAYSDNWVPGDIVSDKAPLLHWQIGHSLLGRRRRRLLPENETTQGGQEKQEGEQEEHCLPFHDFVFPLPANKPRIHRIIVFRHTAASSLLLLLLPSPPPRIQHLWLTASIHLQSSRNFAAEYEKESKSPRSTSNYLEILLKIKK